MSWIDVGSASAQFLRMVDHGDTLAAEFWIVLMYEDGSSRDGSLEVTFDSDGNPERPTDPWVSELFEGADQELHEFYGEMENAAVMEIRRARSAAIVAEFDARHGRPEITP